MVELDSQNVFLFRDALVSAFSREEMVELARQVGCEFKVVIAENALKTQALDLIDQMNRRGDLPMLLTAATTSRPHREDLAEIVAHLRERTNLTFELRRDLRQIFQEEPLSAPDTQRLYNASWPAPRVGK